MPYNDFTEKDEKAVCIYAEMSRKIHNCSVAVMYQIQFTTAKIDY